MIEIQPRNAWLAPRQPLLHQFLDLAQDPVLGQMSRVEHNRIFGGDERRSGSRTVSLVALPKLGSHCLRRWPLDLLLIQPALFADNRIGIKKNLQIGVRENFGPNVAALHHYTAPNTHLALP